MQPIEDSTHTFEPGDLLLLSIVEEHEPDVTQLAIVRLLHTEQGEDAVYGYFEYIDPASDGSKGRSLLTNLRPLSATRDISLFGMVLTAAHRLSHRMRFHDTVIKEFKGQQRLLETQMGLLRENALRGRQTLLACVHNMTQATHLAVDQLAEATAQHLATEERANTLERQLAVYEKRQAMIEAESEASGQDIRLEEEESNAQ